MARKTETLTTPAPQDDLIAVPRVALQALAEWAYPMFASDRIWAKLPAQNPRWISWNLRDDLHVELEQERLAFLKKAFWRAFTEASERERALDPARGYGGSPSLELFVECLAGMEDPHWDEPLAPKEVTKRKKEIKSKKAERVRLKDALEHPTSESTLNTITMSGDIALHILKGNLASADPEIKARAQAEIPRLMAELGKLKTA